jgi:rhomboid protease GluP
VAQPVVTWALLGITTIVSLITIVGVEQSTAGLPAELLLLLRLDKFAVYLDGEYWRLLSVTLVHGGIIHLLFNMYALWIIGPIVEALYGPGRYLAIYLLCAAAGSAATCAMFAAPAVGASGAIFGLFGTLLVADRVHKPALTRNARNLTAQIGILIGINLVIGFSLSGIDNAAHIGGLLAGAWLGLVVVPRGARLASFWSRPATASSPSTAGRPEATPDRAVALRQLAGVAALVAVIVIVLATGPYTWHIRDFLAGGRQPVVTAEVIGDAVGVPTLGSRPALSGSRLGSGGSIGGLRD